MSSVNDWIIQTLTIVFVRGHLESIVLFVAAHYFILLQAIRNV